MFAQTHWLEGAGGAAIAWHHAKATTTPRAILLISHGLAEHARRYARFAAIMSARGYEVYAHDHRGHGETTAPDAPPGRFAAQTGVERVLADVVAVRDMAAARHPGLPVILLGHSMGGLISLNTVLDYPDRFDGVAVWNSHSNPGLAGRAAQLILRAERMLKGSDVPSDLMPRLTFAAWGKSIADAQTPFDWLSRDPDEVARYIADPLCGFDASVSLWIDVLALTFRGSQRLKTTTLRRDFPFHLVGGGADPATDRGRAVVWLGNHLKTAGFSHISTRIYPEMRHETLNEIGFEAAISDFSAWCAAISARA